MSKPFTKQFSKYLLLLVVFFSTSVFALETDKQDDFILDGDNFTNLPTVKEGMTQVKFFGNVSIEQGTLKITAAEAIVYKTKDGIDKVVLTGEQVYMEQFIDAEYGKINIKADRIDYRIKDDNLLMTGSVVVNSKIQGQMSGEKISMNLKTKEIKGEKSSNGSRVRLTIPAKK